MRLGYKDNDFLSIDDDTSRGKSGNLCSSGCPAKFPSNVGARADIVRIRWPDPHSVVSGAPCFSFHSADQRTAQSAMYVRHCCGEELRKVLSKYIRFSRYKPTLNAE